MQRKRIVWEKAKSKTPHLLSGALAGSRPCVSRLRTGFASVEFNNTAFYWLCQAGKRKSGVPESGAGH